MKGEPKWSWTALGVILVLAALAVVLFDVMSGGRG